MDAESEGTGGLDGVTLAGIPMPAAEDGGEGALETHALPGIDLGGVSLPPPPIDEHSGSEGESIPDTGDVPDARALTLTSGSGETSGTLLAAEEATGVAGDAAEGPSETAGMIEERDQEAPPMQMGSTSIDVALPMPAVVEAERSPQDLIREQSLREEQERQERELLERFEQGQAAARTKMASAVAEQYVKPLESIIARLNEVEETQTKILRVLVEQRERFGSVSPLLKETLDLFAQIPDYTEKAQVIQTGMKSVMSRSEKVAERARKLRWRKEEDDREQEQKRKDQEKRAKEKERKLLARPASHLLDGREPTDEDDDDEAEKEPGSADAPLLLDLRNM